MEKVETDQQLVGRGSDHNPEPARKRFFLIFWFNQFRLFQLLWWATSKFRVQLVKKKRKFISEAWWGLNKERKRCTGYLGIGFPQWNSSVVWDFENSTFQPSHVRNTGVIHLTESDSLCARVLEVSIPLISPTFGMRAILTTGKHAIWVLFFSAGIFGWMEA